ncbi:VOC family protein [Actinomarinicola tropica]|uniref:Glyoxalase-like domain-containing protein n=1 Tax=Actinomarinicola tropica TaxID=2789776 RepID=A0A5Q2RGI7_9ACTN|nr:VOC family protein [Actinomarinicola tropica]QGG93922.1 hypothetical protein GH723_01700 [Actinomarinicola tropica]
MALARWKDLCIDAADAAVVGRFWADALGLELTVDDDGDAVLRGARPEETIWINAVPEPTTSKNRVHLDVDVTSLDPLLDLGATVLRPEGDGGIRWTLLADPEGNELCAFLRDEIDTDAPARRYAMVVDCASSQASQAEATWWADVLGATVNDDGRGFWWVEGIDGFPFDSWDLVPVPEPKTVKNRIHWDLVCDDVPALVARGCTVLRAPDGDISWHVLADPAGNELCAFPSAE